MKHKNKLSESLQTMLDKAKRSLKASQRLSDAGDYDFASSRAYYAAFYAMEAILLTKELSFSKHAAVISKFNQFFIKKGIFPKEYGKLIARLFRERQMGDYDFNPDINKEDSEKDIEIAKQLLDEIRGFLIRERFIED